MQGNSTKIAIPVLGYYNGGFSKQFNSPTFSARHERNFWILMRFPCINTDTIYEYRFYSQSSSTIRCFWNKRLISKHSPYNKQTKLLGRGSWGLDVMRKWYFQHRGNDKDTLFYRRCHSSQLPFNLYQAAVVCFFISLRWRSFSFPRSPSRASALAWLINLKTYCCIVSSYITSQCTPSLWS